MAKPVKPRIDRAREHRIEQEIVVDAYGPEEQALGWYAYMDDALQFPFLARCADERATSPLQIGDEVEVVGMPPEEVCEHEMFVLTPGERRTLGVPLAQLAALHADEHTHQVIEDWQYWVERGYRF